MEMNNNLSIKMLSEESRPREKLIKNGAESLLDEELLAIIIGSGTRKHSAISLCKNILEHFKSKDMMKQGMNALTSVNLTELMSISGIKEAKATKILAVVEIAKRINQEKISTNEPITTPGIAAQIFINEMRHLLHEEFRVLGLDTKKRIRYIQLVSKGTMDSTIVHPREVFRMAIDRAAHSILLIHNHPTGDTTPSKADIELTRRLVRSGSLIGIDVVDHIIIGDGNYYSFLEEGLILEKDKKWIE